jgi:hypothetical protein
MLRRFDEVDVLKRGIFIRQVRWYQQIVEFPQTIDFLTVK